MQNVNATFSAPGVPEIMDFDFVPWGNAYFAAVTGNKTYDRGPGMTSWLEQCGMGVKSPPADCFTGEILCRKSVPSRGTSVTSNPMPNVLGGACRARPERVQRQLDRRLVRLICACMLLPREANACTSTSVRLMRSVKALNPTNYWP